MNKFAFTLAEVLITLGIIGVVAALTLPTLINDTKGKELEAQLKVGYSIISQGLKNMQAENGYPPIPAHYPSSGNFYPEYKKYFNKIYDCGVIPLDNDQCMARADNLGGTSSFYTDKVYKTLNGNNLFSYYFDDGQFILPNGMLVVIEDNVQTDLSKTIYISIDINGKSKSPNRLGQDFFTFELMDDGTLLPMGAPGTKYNDKQTYCSSSSSSTLNGIGCAYRVLTEKDYWKKLKNNAL